MEDAKKKGVSTIEVGGSELQVNQSIKSDSHEITATIKSFD